MSVALEHHQPVQIPEMLDEHQPCHPIHPDLATHAQSSAGLRPPSQPNWFASSAPSPVHPTPIEQQSSSAAHPARHQSVPPSIPSHDHLSSHDHPLISSEHGSSPTSLQSQLASVEPLATFQPDPPSHPLPPPSIEPLPTAQHAPAPPAQTLCPEVTLAEPDSTSVLSVSSQLAQTAQAVLDGDENTASGLDHASTLLDDSVAQVDPNSDQHPQEALDCEAHWDSNPLVEDMLYDDYEELDSRPKVRTDLLEHVRVEFEAVSIHDQDQGLPMESDATPAPGVTLTCEGCEYSLFQRAEPCSNSDQTAINDETVLLSEPECRELYYGPLEAFIQSLHNIFPNLHDNNKNELVLNFPALEIKVPEDNIYSKEISLFDVDRLHIGARLPDRLHISLEKQPRLVHRFNVLATYVSELVESDPNVDGNSGEVLIEEDSDTPDDPIMVDLTNDAAQPEVFEESKCVPECLSTHDLSTASIAVDHPGVFSSAAEESIGAVIVVTSPKDEEKQPTGTLAATALPPVDGLSSSAAPNHVSAGSSAREPSELTTDDLTVMDESSVMQLSESHQFPEDTDKSTDELPLDPNGEGLETLSEVVHEYSVSDPVVESGEDDFVTVEPPQGCPNENVLNGAESCSNSERTITGLDQLSEGEIEEFVEEESGIPLDADATLVHDPNNALLNDELASGVAVADQDQDSTAFLAPISNHDSMTINLLSTDPSLCHVGSKRNHAEVEDPAENFELTAAGDEMASQSFAAAAAKERAQQMDGQQQLQAQLAKLRGHFHGTQAGVARLLQAVEATLGQELGPTSYYSALVATLQSIQARKTDQGQEPQQKQKQEQHQQTEVDLLYLLAIVVHALPKPVLKAESLAILELIQPRLDQLLLQPNQTNHVHPQSRPIALKSIISILEPIYLSLSAVELKSLKLQSVARSICLRSILPLVLAHQPKLRRASESLISQIILHTPVPLLAHPYLDPVIQFSLDQLQSLAANYATEPELSNTLIISLVKFVQSILPKLTLDHLDRFISILLSPLPKLNNPFVTTTVFNTLENLFGPKSQLDQQRVLSTLTSLINLEPSNPVSLAAKLNALEHGWICLARISPKACSQELPKMGKLTDVFEHFGNSNQSVREASRSLLAGICRYCLTDQEILEASCQTAHHHKTSVEIIRRSILVGLGSSEIIAAGGTVELIAVLKTLAGRLRTRPEGDQPDSLPLAGRLLKDHVLALDKLRSTPLGIEGIIDETLGSICEICGPAFLLDTLPLNLKLDEDQQSSRGSQGRAWLLTVMKIFNSSLGHFISYFVPLSEKLFEKKRNALKVANNKETDKKVKEKCLLQVKIYDTLIDQIWRLLPGYCDLPWDLEVAFNRSFAELLAQVIYSQPTLRPPILNSLRILIDKTVTLGKRSLPNCDDDNQQQEENVSKTTSKNEFGFDAQSHLNHLKSFAANFLSVLFNVYNSSYDANKNSTNDQKATNSNRGYMVDCMRSLLEIIPDKEFNDSYQKIKNILDQSIKAKAQSAVTIQKMLDLLIVLLPRLVTSSTTLQPDRLQEIQDCICQEVFLHSGDANIQKKSYKFLTTFIELICQQGKINLIRDISGLIEKVIGIETTGKVSGPAKRERALLISELVSIIPSDKLHFIPKLLTEVVLGCKEMNSEVRTVSYDGLIKIGKKMKEHGGKVNWKSLLGEIEEDEEEMKDVEQEATIEEYFKMISAGLAGTSPHMVSATIAALSRVLFEFHDELSRSTLDELISTMEIFLNSPNREIAKTAIGFMKVTVVSLPREVVIDQLDQIVPGLLKWANEHKNYFKTNIQNLLERILRKFGFQVLEKFVVNRDENDGGRKLVYSLNKKQNKKKKQQQETRTSNDPNHDEPDTEYQPNQARLGDAYEEALYGGNSSSEDESGAEENNNHTKNKKNPRKTSKPQHDNNLLEDDDEIMNLLDGGRMTNRAMAGKLAKVEKRKQELKRIGAGYKKDTDTGKMIIESEEETEEQEKKKEMNSTNAYLEAINGEDSFKRDARGNVKFNKKRKSTNLEHDQDAIQDGVASFHLEDDHQEKKKKTKRVKQLLGSEFKAKKAGGDRVSSSKDGTQSVKPFAYLPLSSLNSKKKKNHVSKNLNITGKVKGSKS